MLVIKDKSLDILNARLIQLEFAHLNRVNVLEVGDRHGRGLYLIKDKERETRSRDEYFVVVSFHKRGFEGLEHLKRYK